MSKKTATAAAAEVAPAPMTRNQQIAFTLRRKDFPTGVHADEDNKIHRSGRQGVVAKIHDICDRYSAKGKSRSDILARCEKLGIASNTARTQYQRWRNPPVAKKAAK